MKVSTKEMGLTSFYFPIWDQKREWEILSLYEAWKLLGMSTKNADRFFIKRVLQYSLLSGPTNYIASPSFTGANTETKIFIRDSLCEGKEESIMGQKRDWSVTKPQQAVSHDCPRVGSGCDFIPQVFIHRCGLAYFSELKGASFPKGPSRQLYLYIYPNWATMQFLDNYHVLYTNSNIWIFVH